MAETKLRMYFELGMANPAAVENELTGIGEELDLFRGSVVVAFEKISAADNNLTKLGCTVLTGKSEFVLGKSD